VADATVTETTTEVATEATTEADIEAAVEDVTEPAVEDVTKAVGECLTEMLAADETTAFFTNLSKDTAYRLEVQGMDHDNQSYYSSGPILFRTAPGIPTLLKRSAVRL
jgi:hypothetical protein